MGLKAEFRRRLERLYDAVHYALIQNTANGDILPALFSCLT